MEDKLLYQWDREIRAVEKIARKAGQIALQYWNQGITAETKSDYSPVTVADKECERTISRLLEEAFPEDGLLGEEGSAKTSRNGRRWIIDPIDGTRDFLRGNRVWSVLIGLEAQGEVVAGVSFFPAMDEVFTAAKGAGAFCNGSPIHASPIASAPEAVLCVNGLNNVGKAGLSAGLVEWMEQFWAVRSMGGCLDAMMIARGQADLWIEIAGQPWDFAPLKIIGEEAGAKFFNFDGGASIYAGNCVMCAPGMEEMARRFVKCARLEDQ
jgi:histidinol-phosphatase